MEVHHKHGPVRNWREFLKEYGIIVLGVLTALGAEQAVEAIHHHYEVQETRAALNAEISHNLLAAKMTAEQGRCLSQRMNEVERWEKSWESGHPIHLARAIPIPLAMVFRTSVWRVTAADAVARMPLNERTTYAALYDGIDVQQRLLDNRGNAWKDLALYQGARRLSDDQLLQIKRDIASLRLFQQLLAQDYASDIGLAKMVHVEPEQLDAADAEQFKAVTNPPCDPLLTS